MPLLTEKGDTTDFDMDFITTKTNPPFKTIKSK